MARVQTELLDAYRELSEAWLNRVRSEVELWSDLATKIATTRAYPDGLEMYRECISRRLKMAAEDGQHLLEDGQKVIAAMTRASTEEETEKTK
jgi:hypothetical protein